MRCDNHNGVADMNTIVAARNDDASVSIDKCHEQALANRELAQRNTDDSGFFLDTEFDGFYAGIKQMIQRFDVVAVL